MIVDRPRLTKTGPSSILIFLKAYDQYCRTIIGRTKQLLAAADDADKTITTEVSIPMKRKYCVEATRFSSCIALGFMKHVMSFDSLTYAQLQPYLDKKAAEWKDPATLVGLNELVSKELVMDMSNRNAKSRMQNLFIDYHSLLTKQGLKLIVSDNQKLAERQGLSAIRPVSLRARLHLKPQFSHHDLKEDFNKFLNYAVKLLVAFQIVDLGPCCGLETDRTDNRSRNPGASPITDPNSSTGRDLPLCLYVPCQKRPEAPAEKMQGMPEGRKTENPTKNSRQESC